MRKLVATTFMTLDGVIQAPGGPGEDDDGGFAHGGWSVGYWDERMGELATEIHLGAGGIVFGRRTYEILAAHWPKVGDDDPLAVKLNEAPKYVASRTLEQLEWRNSTRLEGDVAEAIARLKAEDGDYLLVIGSAGLLQTLLRHDLVDTFRLWTFPVVVGEGKRLFGDGAVPAGLAAGGHRDGDHRRDGRDVRARGGDRLRQLRARRVGQRPSAARRPGGTRQRPG